MNKKTKYECINLINDLLSPFVHILFDLKKNKQTFLMPNFLAHSGNT
jgi:hypothetical protein